MSERDPNAAVYLKLPATSANLGPGFDALGLAISLYLTIEAGLSAGAEFSILATGRDSAVCGSLEKNLILDTYSDVLKLAGQPVRPLSLVLNNEIPLASGCGSSAAALLAGVLLANHFGDLGWTGYEAMEEACRREGHPDNVAACWLGWMTISAVAFREGIRHYISASCGQHLTWKMMLAVPQGGLATHRARALLPDSYNRADAVANIQNAALLVAAFASGRGELLRTAMADRLHQPYRSASCPLLPLLLPLSERPGFLGVALSGAGPSVLIIAEPNSGESTAAAVRKHLRDHQHEDVELIEVTPSKGSIFRLLR